MSSICVRICLTRPSIACFAARALDDRRVVLVDRDLLRPAEIFERQVLELDAEVFSDRPAVGEDGDVLEHGLSPVTVAWRFDGGGLQRPAQLVHDERRQRLALHVLGDDQQRLAALCDTLEHRQQILQARDLLFVDENVRILEHDFHPLWIGHEVRRQIPAIELHPFDDLERRVHRLGLFDRDHAVLADLVHGLGDDRADGLVVVGRDGANLGDHLAAHRLRHLLQFGGDHLHRPLDAALDVHRVRAGDHMFHAFAIDGLREHGGGRGAIPGDIRRLARDFTRHLGTHIFERVSQIDLFGDSHAVLGNRRRSELLVEDDIAALGTQGDLDRVGQLIDAAQDGLARLVAVHNLLCH